jgi:hypothetical protein
MWCCVWIACSIGVPYAGPETDNIVGYRNGKLQWKLGDQIEDVNLRGFTECPDAVESIPGARSFQRWTGIIHLGKKSYFAGTILNFENGTLVTIRMELEEPRSKSGKFDSDNAYKKAEERFDYLTTYYSRRFAGVPSGRIDSLPEAAWWHDRENDWLEMYSDGFDTVVQYTRRKPGDVPIVAQPPALNQEKVILPGD